ncbi:MAG: nucleoside monophosphate kinase [Candidatus Saccharibacteria bacterium]|nr:nucleoside monophosphate kinase [Candidatus Saccharibacteria bacterium]
MIMIYGPAGSGKSTQGELLASKIGGKALSVGQICRDKFFEYTKTAAMVPEDELAKAVLAEVSNFEDKEIPVILDGQPWSRDSKGSEILSSATLGVIVINVPREESIKRLSSRGRDDDELSNWNKKLDMFEERMPEYEKMLTEKNIPVYHVDGVGEIPEITERIYTLYTKIVQN